MMQKEDMEAEDNFDSSHHLNEFKKWIDSQNDGSFSTRNQVDEMIGRHVFPLLNNPKRLTKYMSVEIGDFSEINRDFRRNGGKVIRVDEHYLIIEVNSGSFSLPKYFVIF